MVQGGGMVQSVEESSRRAVSLICSGPAAAPSGAIRLGQCIDSNNLFSVDMGGTSYDVCLIRNGVIPTTDMNWVGEELVAMKLVDVPSVGAGGGSIAWINSLGLIEVGPQSAGADPGPACYGRGGSEPATTDADLVIGTIRPGAFLGGRMTLDGDAARRAFEPIAARFGLGIEQAASSALQLADANIVRAIQLVSTERGRDPRDYALGPFGGAGPLHASRIA